MIRFDKLTLKGQEALQSAQSHAQENGNPQVAPEHLLFALVEQKEGVVLPILQKLGVNLQALARTWRTLSPSCPRFRGRRKSTSVRDSIESWRTRSKKPTSSKTNTSAPNTC